MRAAACGCSWCPPTRRTRSATCSARRSTPTGSGTDPGAGRRRGRRRRFLDALALDTLALLEARWREIAGVLSGRFEESELGQIAPEELSALPGIQEVLGLHEVGELATVGEWDHVVVDCASTADALRMLTLPATFGCTWSGPGRGTAG
jgi:anion-transporting  ArsA/GET3 family ATPase